MDSRATPRTPRRRGSPRTKEAMSEETRRRLLAAGRRAFAARGFADASAEEISDKAGLTRGALHYQFGDKRGLFEAVVRVLLAEVAEHVAKETMSGGTPPEDELERGCDSLLASYGKPDVRSILLRDAPVVLGLGTWQRLQEEAGQSAFLRHALEHWVEVGWIDAARVEPLARLLLGALTQAALAIGEAGDRGAEQDRYRSEIRALLRAIRSQPASASA
jgi:AcrR family transcriptional regulator